MPRDAALVESSGKWPEADATVFIGSNSRRSSSVGVDERDYESENHADVVRRYQRSVVERVDARLLPGPRLGFRVG